MLAADHHRTVLLIEPKPGDREEASRRAGPGVRVDGPEALSDGTKADSVVVSAWAHDPLDALGAVLAHPVGGAPLAVIVHPGGEGAVVEALERAGRSATVVWNEIRLASTVAVSDSPTAASQVRSLAGAGRDPTAALVLADVDPVASVLIGTDAGPASWWGDTEALRGTLQQIDEEMNATALARERDLEQAVADAERRWQDAESRLSALIASTSWRVTAPLRRASDIVKRR